jgi:hypothetical protein
LTTTNWMVQNKPRSTTTMPKRHMSLRRCRSHHEVVLRRTGNRPER